MIMKIREILKKNLRKNNKGFTLIELLVVVVILGVLAAVIVPKISVSSTSAKLAADDANLKILQSAVERYYVDKGSYPSTLDVLEGGYISSDVPKAQTSGKEFKYDNSTGQVTIGNKST